MSQESPTSNEFKTPEQILNYAKRLEGMTFREVLDLGIAPEGVSHEYSSRSYKGGMGNLLEERYFGYRANSDREADFPEAGVELKATCIDYRKDGTEAAGERLVLTMIPYDEELPDSLYDSHLWDKCKQLLLVWYRRDKNIEKYDQTIEYVRLFTPPEDDLRVMETDYALITGLIKDGRADELSESLTSYLAACTKGSNAEKSLRDQVLYSPGKAARSRAFSFKRPYMEYVLHHYILNEPEPERLSDKATELSRQELVHYVTKMINAHIGKSDRELCQQLEISYTGNKAQWTSIAYRLLGVRGNRAAEFDKAGIHVRTVRLEPDGNSLRESVPILNINFKDLLEEPDWEDSELRNLLTEQSLLFVVFQKEGDEAILRGSFVWNMPIEDIDGPARECWERTREVVASGVELTPRQGHDGKLIYQNNLPKISDGLDIHVRPRATTAAYRFEDGTEIGNVERDAEELPDGRWMTRQAFWLNSDYVLEAIKNGLGK